MEYQPEDKAGTSVLLRVYYGLQEAMKRFHDA